MNEYGDYTKDYIEGAEYPDIPDWAKALCELLLMDVLELAGAREGIELTMPLVDDKAKIINELMEIIKKASPEVITNNELEEMFKKLGHDPGMKTWDPPDSPPEIYGGGGTTSRTFEFGDQAIDAVREANDAFEKSIMNTRISDLLNKPTYKKNKDEDDV